MKEEDDTGTEGHMLLGVKSQCGRDGHRRMMLEYGISSSVYHPKGCERLKAAQRRIPEMMQQLVCMVNGGSELGLKTQTCYTWQKEGHEAVHLLYTGSYSSLRTQHTW